ncbi:MAG: hypothetical protein M3Q27_06815 [Actinomycetota bacterium]|nr:hypothetical protein [Actinomycetota bacterium]
MTLSRKVQAIRADWAARRAVQENEHPDLAAERAAQSFELAAIKIPRSLVADESAPESQAKIYRRAVQLYQTVVMAGPEGRTLASLHLGQADAEALRLLRASGAVSESVERRPDKAGRIRQLIVLRGAPDVASS